jgi:uncharacterized protein
MKCAESQPVANQTTIEIGRVNAIFRYPVKSMAGESMDVASVGWHGIEGDRRLAFRRLADKSEFPWLTASKLPQLLLYRPFRHDRSLTALPTHVRTPDGHEFEIQSEELREEISSRYGSQLELMKLKHGIFDEGCLSAISLNTVSSIERGCGRKIDLLRFRPNIVIETSNGKPFGEDSWVGRTLLFGEAHNGVAVRATLRDERCVMVNFDPETAELDSNVMKTVVRMNGNYAGVYGTVVRAGELRVDQTVCLA